MISSPSQRWPLRVSQADSYKELNCLMDDWYGTIKADYRLQNSMDFESYMGARDWDGAKRSVERTYGRSCPEHRSTLETLNAAIQNRTQMKWRQRLELGEYRDRQQVTET
jgi:hypothetical protein